MFRGLYTATSGMIASSRMQEMLSNNLANVNTPGYKSDTTVLRAFPEMLLQAMNVGTELGVHGKPNFPIHKEIGSINTGVYAQEGILDFSQGALKQTNRFVDFAIIDGQLPVNPETEQKGNIFFAVQTGENQIGYTRNGQFAVDGEGFLTTGEGLYVLNQNQEPINIGDGLFEVSERGQILGEDGQPTGEQLWLGYTEEPNRLVKNGHGVLEWVEGEGNPPQLITEVEFLNDPDNPNLAAFQLKQGYIETSNVDVTQTMTEMMNMYRQFEANQKVIQSYDRSMEKSVNEIGKVY